MIAYAIMALVIVCLFFAFVLIESRDYKRRLEKLVKKANESYGKVNNSVLEGDDLSKVKELFYRYQNEYSIDDITAYDLDLDEIFFKLNNCVSAPGKEYFYHMLRNPVHDEEKLDALEKKISYFSKNRDEALKLRSVFVKIGNMRKASFFECIDFFKELVQKNMMSEYLMDALIVLAIISMFFFPAEGIFALVVLLCINIVLYYKKRGEIESKIIGFGFITTFLKQTHLLKEFKCEAINDEVAELDKLTGKLKGFEKYSSVVVNGRGALTGTGNPLDIFVDYIKMIFHVDIIRFYSMLKVLKDNAEELEKIYFILGSIESIINIASIREAYPEFCVPKTSEGLNGVNMYHPLIEKPVKNSICASTGVLITGSNASGKSTFLKTVAINAIFSHTIHTAFADDFSLDDYYVFSSMSLRDDLTNHDSYFMVEIKALKRIFDFVTNNPDKKVLCFVDEVLRGTNTIERIAAVTQILKKLNASKTLCFAATHDLELTDILESEYANYHFDEEIKDNDILFNYFIKDGKATSKNAIKLLQIMGFSDEIVDSAKDMADRFIKDAVWR